MVLALPRRSGFRPRGLVNESQDAGGKGSVTWVSIRHSTTLVRLGGAAIEYGAMRAGSLLRPDGTALVTATGFGRSGALFHTTTVAAAGTYTNLVYLQGSRDRPGDRGRVRNAARRLLRAPRTAPPPVVVTTSVAGLAELLHRPPRCPASVGTLSRWISEGDATGSSTLGPSARLVP
jgi:hypothetical protein